MLIKPVARLGIEVVRECVLVWLAAMRHALSRVNHELNVLWVTLVALKCKRGNKIWRRRIAGPAFHQFTACFLVRWWNLHCCSRRCTGADHQRWSHSQQRRAERAAEKWKWFWTTWGVLPFLLANIPVVMIIIGLVCFHLDIDHVQF